MKKIKWMVVAFVLSLLTALSLAACGPSNSQETPTLSLDKAEMTLYIGAPAKLTATVTGTSEAVEWTSSQPAVATVDGEGNVSPIKEGSTNIFVRVGNLSDYCRVTVSDGDSLTVDTASIDLVVKKVEGVDGEVSKKINVTAAAKGETVTNPVLKWSTSDKDVASVAEDGTISAIGAGKASVTVKFDSGNKELSQIIEVNVTKARLAITLETKHIELGASGDTVDFVLPDSLTLPEGTKIYDKDDETAAALVYTANGQTVSLAKYSAEKKDGIDKYQLYSGKRTLIFDVGDMEYTAEIMVYTKIIMSANEYGLLDTADTVYQGLKDSIRYYSLHDRGTYRTEALAMAFDADADKGISKCGGGNAVTLWRSIDEALNIPVPEDVTKAYIYHFEGYFVFGADIDFGNHKEDGTISRRNTEDWCGYSSNGENWQMTTVEGSPDSSNVSEFGFHGTIDGRGYSFLSAGFGSKKNNGAVLGISLGTGGVVRNITFDNCSLSKAQGGLVAHLSAGLVENIYVKSVVITANAGAGYYDARGSIVGKPSGGTYRNIFIQSLTNTGTTEARWGTTTGAIVGYGVGTYADIYVIGSKQLCKESEVENPRATDNIDTVKGFDTAAEFKEANLDFATWDSAVWELKEVDFGTEEEPLTIVVPVLKAAA